jgi:pyridoxine 4-dehydrogenase
MTNVKSCRPAQIAINWTRAVSKRSAVHTIMPIPSAATVVRVDENSKVIDLTDEEMFWLILRRLGDAITLFSL